MRQRRMMVPLTRSEGQTDFFSSSFCSSCVLVKGGGILVSLGFPSG